MNIKQQAKQKQEFIYQKKQKEDYGYDPHIGCFSWPNCDEDPNGCFFQSDEPEQFGFKD